VSDNRERIVPVRVERPGKTLYAPALRILPGLAVSGVIAMAATFLREHYGGPAMLFALLLGMAFHFLAADERCAAGIEFASKTVLRIGVALLGLRIAAEQLAALGWGPGLIVAAAVATTIVLGVAAARLLGFTSAFGILTGGAVAICGASAAMAISAALPKNAVSQRDTIFAVIGVTTLSTVTMIAYPAIAHALGLSDRDAGYFLGATIHDVAQVVGAGYSISATAGDLAIVTKLTRVTMLVPLVAILALLYPQPGRQGRLAGLRLPWFLLVFVALALANSLGAIPRPVAEVLDRVSQWCLLIAIAALGMKTSLADLRSLGWLPILLMAAETIVIAVVILAAMA
jgi:uncharacterized integral membrane protein (TIGR00698 family)